MINFLRQLFGKKTEGGVKNVDSKQNLDDFLTSKEARMLWDYIRDLEADYVLFSQESQARLDKFSKAKRLETLKQFRPQEETQTFRSHRFGGKSRYALEGSGVR